MEEHLFKKFPVYHSGQMYEIKVFKDQVGCHVYVYLNGEFALPHGYYCDAESDARYKRMFGKTGWQRLIQCAKADLLGKPRYHSSGASEGSVSTLGMQEVSHSNSGPKKRNRKKSQAENQTESNPEEGTTESE